MAGLPPDFTRAFKWAQKAAAAGHPGAQNLLGVMYFVGRGTDSDLSKAVELWRLAADQGFVQAFFNLGRAYGEG